MKLFEVAPSEIKADDLVNNFDKFLQICIKEIGLKKLPKIVWVTDGSHHREHNSFGSFHNDTHEIHVEITNRHPIDVMRTLAHELVHYKQSLEGRIHKDSGNTGSEIENEAHMKAGIIMRHFDNKYPEAFELKAIEK